VFVRSNNSDKSIPKMSLISQREMVQLKETFDYIDSNKDGFLSADELKKFLKTMGKSKHQDKELKKILKRTAKDGLMDFDTFVNITSLKVQDPAEETLNTFKMFDKDGNGFITEQELKQSMHEMGVPLSDEDVKQMIKDKDINGDGVIDYNEFVAIQNSLNG